MIDSQPFLETENLSVGYRSKKGAHLVAENLSLRLSGGQLVCLLGANGSGKSTLLRTIAGLQEPLNGTIYVQQTPIQEISAASLAKILSMVLTDRLDTGNLTVTEVIAIGRTPHTGWLGKLSEQDSGKAAEAAQLTQVTHLLDRKLYELSDGERQKVMLARALSQDTPVILLDEPTAHLDVMARVEMIVLLKKLARQTKKAILLSTHDFDLALRTADELWLMGKDKTLAAGAPEDLVLSGAFERAFSRPGFTFNAASGTLEIDRHDVARKVSLSGDPHLVFWTQRALQREGIGLNERDLAQCRINATIEAGLPVWTVFFQNENHTLQSVKKLLEFVQKALP